MKTNTTTTKRTESKPNTAREESSSVFSLAELSRMEVDRLRNEAEAARLEGEAILARAEAEKARLVMEDRARARREEEEARAQDAAEREQSARIAAMAEATRVAAEIKARAEVEERRRAEDRSLERARLEAASRGKRRVFLGAVIGALVAAGAAFAIQLGVVQPKNDRLLADVRGQFDARGCENDALKQRLAEEEKKRGLATADLNTVNARIEELVRENAGLKKQVEAPVVRKSEAPVIGGAATTAPVVVRPVVEQIPAGFHRCTAARAAATKDPFCWSVGS